MFTRNQITLGSDPEVFACHQESASPEFVKPAYFVLGGDIDLDLPYGKAYADGAALEFTIDPSSDPDEMANRLGANLMALEAEVISRGYRISLVSNGEIAYEEIKALPESFGKRCSLQILGCAPDVRIYHWVSNINRPDPKEYPYRTIGCHIHVGIGPMVESWPFVQFVTAFLDASIGTAGVYLLANDRPAQLRNYLYGKSGTIRVKEAYQAVEYRTLPSQVVCCTRQAAKAFFGLAQETVYLAHQIYDRGGFTLLREALGGMDGMKETQEAIDNARSRARHAQTRFQDRLIAILGDEADRFNQLVGEVSNIVIPGNYQMSW